MKKLSKRRLLVTQLLVFLEKDSNVDLTQTFGKKLISYDIIAHFSYISWEGTVLSAKLYTYPFVKSILENFLLPFKEYIGYFGIFPRVSVDYPKVFEWMLLKRFQELFSTEQQPSKIPLLFATQPFGSLCELKFSSENRQFPKITKTGNRLADLNSVTAHHQDWRRLMTFVDALPDICL